MAGKPQPLDSRFPITNADGTPTEYFVRWAQERQIDISGGITVAVAQELINDWAEDRDIVAGVGLGGGGPLSDDVELYLDAALNDLSDVLALAADGDVLTFRDGLWVAEAPQGGGGTGGSGFGLKNRVIVEYTGADYEYVVPAEIKKVRFHIWGGAGAGGQYSGGRFGGGGGYVRGDVLVTEGDAFTLQVGQGGRFVGGQNSPGGWPDGGAGAFGDTTGGGGGGSSRLFSGTSLLAVAGAGGGAAGYDGSGGPGGGLVGGEGRNLGHGGTQNGPGTAGQPPGLYNYNGNNGEANVFWENGRVAPLTWETRHWQRGGFGGPQGGGTNGDGGGGGGGYFGGSGGSGDGCAGGGGSGFLSPDLLDGSLLGAVVQNPPSTNVEGFIAGRALGSESNSGQPGGNGLIIIEEYVPGMILDDLLDVDTVTTPPTDGQALVFDAATKLWIPQDQSGGGGGGGGGGSRIMAAARFDCTNAAAPAILGGVNVSSIVKQGTGRYRINFTAPINIAKAGFNGGGAWGTDANATTVLVGVDRKDGTGLFADHVDLITFDGNANQLFDCNNWFSFELYDVTQQSGGGGGGGKSPFWPTEPRKPLLPEFSVVRSTNAASVLEQTDRGVVLNATLGGGDFTSVVEQAVNAGGNWDLKTFLSTATFFRPYTHFGLCLRDATTGRLHTFGLGQGSNTSFREMYWNVPGSFAGSPFESGNIFSQVSPVWMRLKKDGGNVTFYLSTDGEFWFDVRTVSATAFCATPDRAGIVVVHSSDNYAGRNMPVHIMAFDITA